MSKTHIFIIWNRTMDKKNIIINEIEKKFTIREIFQIKWNKNDFLKNIKRFYGKKLPKPEQKAKECGNGEFLVIFVNDEKPQIEITRIDDVNQTEINSRVFNAKQEYRKIIGGGFQIHASNSDEETEHDVALLFGKTIKNFEKELPKQWNKKIKDLGEMELVGNKKWKNFEEFFEILNSTTNYVVLRNYEDIPEKLEIKDLDIITDDIKNFSEIINLNDPSTDSPIIINDKKIQIDFRYQIGHHYDETWGKKILENKILYNNLFYIPSKEDYFYSLFYHNLKKESKKYNEKLLKLGEDLGIEIDLKEIINDEQKSKEFISKYMAVNKLKDTNSISRTIYKFKKNELTRLIKTGFFLINNYGFYFFIKKMILKIKNMT